MPEMGGFRSRLRAASGTKLKMVKLPDPGGERTFRPVGSITKSVQGFGVRRETGKE
jgi:ribosomal protein L34